MLAIKQQLTQTIAQVLEQLSPGAGTKAVLENPRHTSHGDFACTAAMQLAKQLKQNPRQLAQQLVEKLNTSPVFTQWVENLEIAGPGFLNISLTAQAKQQIIKEILTTKDKFGQQPTNGKSVIIEFVSANPTGPLHVGHGRQAAIGDALANLFSSQGWQVWREFYYNDAGVQIEILTNSVQLRAKGIKPGDIEWPENAYNGEYIQDIANAFIAKQSVTADDRNFTANGDVEDLEAIRKFAVAYLRHEQDLDLKAFKVNFDNYFLESSLYKDAKVDAVVATISNNNKTYEKDNALWFKSTDYGDDKDRVMRKSDASYTYFVPDIAYHQNKWQRGYDKAINIQGTDHHGTINRVRAGLQALEQGIAQGYPDYVLHTMVRVIRGGKEVKISKRAGSYITLRDLIEWTNKDAVRFFLLSRKPDTEYTFDIDLALAKNNENPVYYVQYAHTRICSILASWGQDIAQLQNAKLDSLTNPAALALMYQLAKYPSMLISATQDFAPHDVTFYLRELAAAYHTYYDSERILVEDIEQKLARLALVAATAQVINNGLAIIGVDAPEKM